MFEPFNADDTTQTLISDSPAEENTAEVPETVTPEAQPDFNNFTTDVDTDVKESFEFDSSNISDYILYLFEILGLLFIAYKYFVRKSKHYLSWSLHVLFAIVSMALVYLSNTEEPLFDISKNNITLMHVMTLLIQAGIYLYTVRRPSFSTEETVLTAT